MTVATKPSNAGSKHAHTPALVVVTTTTVTVLSKTTHQLIANHTVDPNPDYWPNQQKDPGRWPGSFCNR